MPPYRRVVELSAWLNRWNSRACGLRRDADAGVVHREAQHAGVGSSACAAARARMTSPASVNLIALPSRLSRICRSRAGSPTTHGGHVGVDHGAAAPSPLRVRLPATMLERPPRSAAQVEGDALPDPACPASIFEKSRMSLMTPSSASPELRMVSA